MIIVTGGAGFIGTNVVKALNDLDRSDILVVDKLRSGDKWKNLRYIEFKDFIDKDEFLAWLEVATPAQVSKIDAIVHMGACSATTEKDADYLMHNNTKYTKALYLFCKQHRIPFIYASSAATYGAGEKGYDDSVFDLMPLNMYGYSKKLFDDFVIANHDGSFQCVGLKFFNVYGPYEYHKGSMASVIYHSYNQINSEGVVKLFKSDVDTISDGEQSRDFVYVKDVAQIVVFFLQHKELSGIFNVGTGIARSFNDLARATFAAMGKDEAIFYVDMPHHLKGKYQNFTQAKMRKLESVGYNKPFHTLEHGVADYVKNHLDKEL
jgi:ADP-L-glycero-D-manno-heptose 6-epimerase